MSAVRDAFLVGFTTWRGTVTAAADWGARPEQMRVRTARHDSYEALFHAVGEPRFMIIWRGHDAAAEALRGPRLERAIGVIYRPETELQSHYFWARLPEQFDAVPDRVQHGVRRQSQPGGADEADDRVMRDVEFLVAVGARALADAAPLQQEPVGAAAVVVGDVRIVLDGVRQVAGAEMKPRITQITRIAFCH